MGSTFTLEMPCFTDPAPTAGSSAAIASPGEHRRILVVDDNADAAESLAVLLRLDGHHVSVAHNGVDAVSLAARTAPTVILLDSGLPGMDGYEVCRRLREGGFREAKIIAMTGYGQERDRRRSEDAGFDAHTVKPVAIDDLKELLRTP